MKKKTLAQAPKTFGAMARLTRESQHISQKQLAKKARVSNKDLSRIELGQVEPSLSIAVSIADALATSLDILVGKTNTHSTVDVRVRIPLELPRDDGRLKKIMKAASE